MDIEQKDPQKIKSSGIFPGNIRKAIAYAEFGVLFVFGIGYLLGIGI